MIIALSIADALMMGGYFNHFFEAAGEKIGVDGKETGVENLITHVATWGEGSLRAQNLERYGQIRKHFFAEGVEGIVPYKGRLKPVLKKDLWKMRAAMSNAGCVSLDTFRKEAIIELNSPHSTTILSSSHGVEKRK